MRRWLLFLALLLVHSPAWASWTLLQHVVNTSCSGTSCSVTVSSTGAGHVLVGAAFLGTSPTVISSMSGGGTWTLCSACHGGGNYDLAYNLSSSSGATTITFNWSATDTAKVDVLEYSTNNGPATLDTSGRYFDGTSCTSCLGLTLTLSGTNDLVIQTATGGTNVTAIVAPFTSPADVFSGLGVGGSINTASGSPPTFTMSGATTSTRGAAIAFAELPTFTSRKPLTY